MAVDMVKSSAPYGQCIILNKAPRTISIKAKKVYREENALLDIF